MNCRFWTIICTTLVTLVDTTVSCKTNYKAQSAAYNELHSAELVTLHRKFQAAVHSAKSIVLVHCIVQCSIAWWVTHIGFWQITERPKCNGGAFMPGAQRLVMCNTPRVWKARSPLTISTTAFSFYSQLPCSTYSYFHDLVVCNLIWLFVICDCQLCFITKISKRQIWQTQYGNLLELHHPECEKYGHQTCNNYWQWTPLISNSYNMYTPA